MRWKHLGFVLMTLASLWVPSTLNAMDFEWRLSLNLRAQSDPYGYRYGLMNRFAMPESEVIMILNRVYEPADAYMIFRLAELSGHSPEYVLRIYHERRHLGWHDISYILGIRPDRQEFIVLRDYHDMRDVYYDYNFRRKERYEERYRAAPMPKHYVPAPRHYTPPPPPKYVPPRPEHHESSHHKYHRPAPTHHEKRETYTSNTYSSAPKKEPHHHRPPQERYDNNEEYRKHH